MVMFVVVVVLVFVLIRRLEAIQVNCEQNVKIYRRNKSCERANNGDLLSPTENVLCLALQAWGARGLSRRAGQGGVKR